MDTIKKVAFVSYGHSGSTLPLIKRFLLRGYSVDYYVTNTHSIDLDMEGTDCIFQPSHKGIEEITVSHWPLLYDYMDSGVFHIYSINSYRPYASVVGLNRLMSFFQKKLIKGVCKHINKQNYEFVDVIGRYNVPDIIQYVNNLIGTVFVSLHEVCDHQSPDFEHPNGLLKCLFKRKTPIVVFSQKSYNDICKYKDCKNENVHIIHFGKFESYKIFRGSNELALPEKYFLFIGRMTPYKGLDILYRATRNYSGTYKFVVAGSGYSEVLDNMSDDPKYVVINRFLKENELAELIEKSNCVVCPYTSVSQSGIPQTVSVFEKPIIASDLPGFNELVKSGVNGLVFSVGNSDELALCINNVSDNEELLCKITNGASDFERQFEDYSWDNIVERYINIFIK